MHLHNMAHRHRRAARKLGTQSAPTQDYVVVDSSHRPDLRGEFAGVKVRHIGHQHVVSLSDTAARFYLDSGSIRPLK